MHTRFFPSPFPFPFHFHFYCCYFYFYYLTFVSLHSPKHLLDFFSFLLLFFFWSESLLLEVSVLSVFSGRAFISCFCSYWLCLLLVCCGLFGR